MAREAKLMVAIGKKGVGKSFQTLELISSYLNGFNGKSKPRKCLIIDVNDEFDDPRGTHKNPKLPSIKTIPATPEALSLFTRSKNIECRRIRPYNKDGSNMDHKQLQETLKVVLANYQYGLLLVEDINKYISDSLPMDFFGKLTTMRHVSVDVVIHYQGIKKALHPKIFPNTNIIRWHKCGDSVRTMEKKHQVALFFLAEQLVDFHYKKGDKRFNCYVDLDNEKIYGKFTKHTFQKAIENHLQENYSEITKEANRSDIRTGKKIHASQKDAVEYLIEEYTKNYYGNKE